MNGWKCGGTVNHGQNLPRLVNELISLGMVPVSELSYRYNSTVECVNGKQHYNIMCDGQQGACVRYK